MIIKSKEAVVQGIKENWGKIVDNCIDDLKEVVKVKHPLDLTIDEYAAYIFKLLNSPNFLPFVNTSCSSTRKIKPVLFKFMAKFIQIIEEDHEDMLYNDELLKDLYEKEYAYTAATAIKMLRNDFIKLFEANIEALEEVVDYHVDAYIANILTPSQILREQKYEGHVLGFIYEN